MGGTLSVASEEGAGSSFTFTVPMEEVGGATANPCRRRPYSSKMLKMMLERHGYQMELAQTGQEAVEMWDKDQFDLILMDVQISCQSH